ncbi:MAG: hypothetical protein IJ806_09405 [Ruminococcus sp.]|nr:hypothetical protein [Ruminococcus sp.]
MNNKFMLLSMISAMINDRVKGKKKTRTTKIALAVISALMIVSGFITLTEVWVDVDCDEDSGE